MRNRTPRMGTALLVGATTIGVIALWIVFAPAKEIPAAIAPLPATVVPVVAGSRQEELNRIKALEMSQQAANTQRQNDAKEIAALKDELAKERATPKASPDKIAACKQGSP